MKNQIPNMAYTFPCGCSGILPAWGESNKFARFRSTKFKCRVSAIWQSVALQAKKGGYKSLAPTYAHADIREMMETPNCCICLEPLSWNRFAVGYTPVPHHDHETGELYGFAHARCNIIASLRGEQIVRMKTALRFLDEVIDEIDRKEYGEAKRHVRNAYGEIESLLGLK